jgi:hypothetical protein
MDIFGCQQNLSSVMSSAIRNPLHRRQSAVNPLYAIYYLEYSESSCDCVSDQGRTGKASSDPTGFRLQLEKLGLLVWLSGPVTLDLEA